MSEYSQNEYNYTGCGNDDCTCGRDEPYDYYNPSENQSESCDKPQPCPEYKTCFGPYVVVPSLRHPNTSIIREKKVRELGDQAMLSVNSGVGSANEYAIPIMDQELIAVTNSLQSEVKLYKACNMGYLCKVNVDSGPSSLWYYQPCKQLWVVCVDAKTVNVICTENWKVIKKISLPKDLSCDYNFNDVTVTHCGAIVSLTNLTIRQEPIIIGSSTSTIQNGNSIIINGSSTSTIPNGGSSTVIDSSHTNGYVGGYLLKYNLCSFKERGRLAVDFYPKVLSFGLECDYLYCATQGGKVYKIDPRKFKICRESCFVGASGLWLSNNRQRLFVSNIYSRDGVAAIGVFDAKKLKLKYSIDSIIPHPRNLVLSQDNCSLYVTHTANSQVTVHYLKRKCLVKEVKTLSIPPEPVGITRYPLILSNPCQYQCHEKCEDRCHEVKNKCKKDKCKDKCKCKKDKCQKDKCLKGCGRKDRCKYYDSQY